MAPPRSPQLLHQQHARRPYSSIRPPSSLRPEPSAARIKLRNYVWTFAFASITIVGALYGAGLKTRRDWANEKKRVEELSVDERIAILEGRRKELVRQRNPINDKLQVVKSRIAAEKEGESGNGDK